MGTGQVPRSTTDRLTSKYYVSYHRALEPDVTLTEDVSYVDPDGAGAWVERLSESAIAKLCSRKSGDVFATELQGIETHLGKAFSSGILR